MSPSAASFVFALTCIAIDAFELQEKSVVDVCQKRSNNRLLAWEKCHDIGDSLTNQMQSQRGILSTPVMLRGCQKQWPFQLNAENNQTLVLCIKCRPDAPDPMAIAQHKKHVIWLCDTSEPFSQQADCEGTVSWLGKKSFTETGRGSHATCKIIRKARDFSLKAAGKVADLHHRSLVLQNDTNSIHLSSLPSKLRSATLWEVTISLRMEEKSIKRVFGAVLNSVDVVYQVEFGDISGTSFLYISFTHTRRSCGGLPPLSKMQCIETKHTECDRVTVKMEKCKLNTKLKMQWKSDKSWLDRVDRGSKVACGDRDLMALATRKHRRKNTKAISCK